MLLRHRVAARCGKWLVAVAMTMVGVNAYCAGPEWVWPVEGRNAGEDILYSPQQYIGEERNFGDLFIGATAWCKGAGTGGTDRMVVYVNHERFIKADELVPLSRVMSAPNVANVCYDTAYMANLSELEIFYPTTITYWDQIGGDT